jgi:hypothetical protein
MAKSNREVPAPRGGDPEQVIAERDLAAQRYRKGPAPLVQPRMNASRMLKHCIAAVTVAALLYASFE